MRRRGRTALLVLIAVVLFAVAVPGLARSGGSVGTWRCRTGQLRVRGHFLGEAMGQFTETLTLINGSARTCRLAGWPGVLLRTGSGSAVRVRQRRVIQGAPTNHPFRTITIHSGRTASFDIYGADFNAVKNQTCPTAHGLLVRPPGDSLTLPVAVRVPACRPLTLGVSPLVAGSSDRGAWAVAWRRPKDFIIGLGHAGSVRGAFWPGDRITCRAGRDAVTLAVPRLGHAAFEQHAFAPNHRLALNVAHRRNGITWALCRWR
jgi:Protein of unknown function (DUF4232)